MLTEQMIRDELARRGGYLARGRHDGGDTCPACARELRAALLGLPWTDDPEHSPTDAAARAINDGPWTSDAARTEGCIPLVLLSEASAVPGWVARYVEATIRLIVPLGLRLAAAMHPDEHHRASLLGAAARCSSEGTQAAAYAARADAAAAEAAAESAADAADAARDAARDAAYAARAARDAARAAAYAAYVARAARAAAYAAAYAAATAATAATADARTDAVLRYAVAVLLACHRGEDPMALEVPDDR